MHACNYNKPHHEFIAIELSFQKHVISTFLFVIFLGIRKLLINEKKVIIIVIILISAICKMH